MKNLILLFTVFILASCTKEDSTNQICKEVMYKAGGRRVATQRITFTDGSSTLISLDEFEKIDNGDLYCF